MTTNKDKYKPREKRLYSGFGSNVVVIQCVNDLTKLIKSVTGKGREN